MNQRALFSPPELMQFQAVVKGHLIAAAKAPLLIFYLMLQATALTIVGVIEWEIIYQVFLYLGGEEGGLWKSELMALSAVIMILGFHLLAKVKPGNLAVRIVESAVQILIPLYLVGIGLLIASILYADGLGGLVEAPLSLAFGDIPEAPAPGWIEQAFEDIANPVAVLTLALGIGGLAVINIFVAHRLLKMTATNLSDIGKRLLRARSALKDHAVIKRSQKAFAETGIEIETLEQRNEAALKVAIASAVMSALDEGLLPHKAWLAEHDVHEGSRFNDPVAIDPAQLTKKIARIEAITFKEVMAALSPKQLEDKS